jgi:hypothetical protein
MTPASSTFTVDTTSNLKENEIVELTNYLLEPQYDNT